MLIGRERELAELDARVRDHRIVTVVGPGGVGKTALAVAVVAQAAPRFPLGTRRVDLTRVERADMVAGAVAAQLGFESYDALLGSPGEQPVLLLVDNCEHLIDAAADAIRQLLESCQAPSVVATSRSPLEIPGESVISLAPLASPPPGHPDPASFAAVALFLERARDAGAPSLGSDDLEAVADVCRRLDGLPLAIELAAARTRTMSVQDIGGRLDTGVDVLTRRHYRGDRRHRSIGDTITWSADLLTASQLDLLVRLGVFAGPFSPESARALLDADDSAGFDDDLDELVHASLVSVEPTGAATRYRLLETVRRHALDRLARDGRLVPTMDRFVDVVAQSAVDSVRGGAVVWRPEMIGEVLGAFDNIAEALCWCNEHDDEPGRAFTLCAVLWTVVHQGRAPEIAALAGQTARRWEGIDHRRRGAALATWASAEYVNGEPERALAIAEPLVDELPRAGFSSVMLLRLIGQARSATGDLAGGARAFDEARALARQAGMSAMAIELDIVHAHVSAIAGRQSDAWAVSELEAAVVAAEELGSPVTVAWARTTLGWFLLRVDVSRAPSIIEQGLTLSRDLDYPIGIAGGLRSSAYARMLAGDDAGAHAVLVELVDELLRRGALSDARLLFDAAATLAHRVGHPRWDMLAATARSLPIMTLLLTPGSEPIPLPPSDATPLPRTQALAGAISVLSEIDQGGALDQLQPDRLLVTAEEAGTTPSLALTGDVWTIDFEGLQVTVRDSKGLADLATLLAAGGREVHCLDLVGAGVHESSTGEVIDADARRAYERRIIELQAEIDEAEHDHDLARAEKAQVEFDILVDHLTSAVGAAGRTRVTGGTVERARSTVTQRLRKTMRRLDDVHPPLGRHLQASITTGIYCAYRPERPTTWVVER